MGPFRILLFILALLSGCSASTMQTPGLAYRGSVIDAQTKAPIEGAVVVVTWTKKPRVTMDGPVYFHNAKEVLTDTEGKFSVDASPGVNSDPFTVVKDPDISIFKPGYGPYPSGHVKDAPIDQTDKALLSTEGTVIKLPRLKSQALVSFTDPGHLLISTVVPYERIPLLMKLINLQRINLGLQPIPIGKTSD